MILLPEVRLNRLCASYGFGDRGVKDFAPPDVLGCARKCWIEKAFPSRVR